jgi:hypothetical protein
MCVLLLVTGVLAEGAEDLEMWYDAKGAAVAILPEEKLAEPFISIWEREALERERRAEVRRQALSRTHGRRSERSGGWVDFGYGYAGFPGGFVFPGYFHSYQPKCYPLRSGGWHGGGIRINVRIH